jgi:hypothetical protein
VGSKKSVSNGRGKLNGLVQLRKRSQQIQTVESASASDADAERQQGARGIPKEVPSRNAACVREGFVQAQGEGQEVKTWHGEFAIVLIAMLAVAHFSGGGLEYVGAAAVVMAFAHAQIADRMTEHQAYMAKPTVSCWRWSRRYFMAKEVLFFAYFAAKSSWAAVAGTLLFLLYPWWRKFHRRRRFEKEMEKGGLVYINGKATRVLFAVEKLPPVESNGEIDVGWDSKFPPGAF